MHRAKVRTLVSWSAANGLHLKTDLVPLLRGCPRVQGRYRDVRSAVLADTAEALSESEGVLC